MPFLITYAVQSRYDTKIFNTIVDDVDEWLVETVRIYRNLPESERYAGHGFALLNTIEVSEKVAQALGNYEPYVKLWTKNCEAID